MHLAVPIAIGIAPAFILLQGDSERSRILDSPDSYRGDADTHNSIVTTNTKNETNKTKNEKNETNHIDNPDSFYAH